MAFNISNLLATLDSSIAALDSASELLEVLQAINATNSTKGYGKTQRKYYTSVASLPAADSALRGMVAVVSTAKIDSANGLYLCTGTSWTEIQDLDSEAPIFQGVNFGYTSGGINPGAPTPGLQNIIDKFTFASDENATDVGDLAIAKYLAAGQSSTASGYISGGYNLPASPSPGGTLNNIEKFPFSITGGNSTDVGDLTAPRYALAGQSSSKDGYVSGGTSPTGGSPYSNIIDKFPFASDANATDVGDLAFANRSVCGQSSSENGYTSGGTGSSNVIQKFPFSSNANASDVGDLTVGRDYTAGQSSSENGYNSGGPSSNVIDKFPFASDANATDVGNLTVARTEATGQSSTTSGYSSGGFPPYLNVIDKFPFASDANATDVGDLTVARRSSTGQQY